MKLALGNRNVARIVGLFATGSFAKDNSQSLEEANAHVALRELEVLTGVGRWRGKMDKTETASAAPGDRDTDTVTPTWESLVC